MYSMMEKKSQPIDIKEKTLWRPQYRRCMVQVGWEVYGGGSREQTGLLTTCRDPLCTAPGCERRALGPTPYRLLL